MTVFEPNNRGDVSLNRQMASGSAWIVAARWGERFVGLVGTIILARLLTPTDYGIVAIATLFIAFVEMFSNTGQTAVMVRHPNPTREHFDTSWTITLITGLVLGLAICALVPLATAYFREPRSELVAYVLTFRTVLFGAQNSAVVHFQRNLEFNKQWLYIVLPPAASLGVMVIAAFVFRNYWALVVGLVFETSLSFLLSYILVSYRPRLCLTKFAEIWSFSAWYLWWNVGSFLAEKMDQFAVGGVFGAAGMGRYTVAGEFATLPNRDVTGSVVAVLYPVMAKAQSDSEKMRELYLTVLYWTALISVAMAVGVAIVSNDLVDLILGPQWHDIKPLMPLLALSYGVSSMGDSVYTSLTIKKMIRTSARLQWTRLIAMAATMFPVAFYFRDLEHVAIARLLVTIAIVPTLFRAVMEPLQINARDYFDTLWRPVVAGSTMTVAVLALNLALPFVGPVRLILDVMLGAATYIGTIMLLWWMIGRPSGPERELWTRAMGLLGRGAN